jgi:DNA (cytosine-5)-methyltransferase 1
MADRELEGRLGLAERGEWNTWDSFPTQSPLCGGDDGLSSRLDSITFPKWRNESIMGYGNAVVPQLIMNIYRSIEAYENQIKNK